MSQDTQDTASSDKPVSFTKEYNASSITVLEGFRLSANVLACILGIPALMGCIIWYMKWSITALMRQWQVTAIY